MSDVCDAGRRLNPNCRIDGFDRDGNVIEAHFMRNWGQPCDEQARHFMYTGMEEMPVISLCDQHFDEVRREFGHTMDKVSEEVFDDHVLEGKPLV